MVVSWGTSWEPILVTNGMGKVPWTITWFLQIFIIRFSLYMLTSYSQHNLIIAILDKIFDMLDNMKNNNPRGYMNIVKSLKSGAFDNKVSDDSSFVSPDVWESHFQNLHGPHSKMIMSLEVTKKSDTQREKYASSSYSTICHLILRKIVTKSSLN